MSPSPDQLADASERLSDSGRPLRADALRNRRRLTEVAMRRFSKDGFDVPLEEIAAEAEVGIATLYRHFPSRAAFMLALVEDQLGPIAANAREVLSTVSDPLDALRATLVYGAELHTTDRALAQLWRRVDNEVVLRAVRSTGLYEATERLLEAVQATGEVAEEVTVEDIARIYYAISGVVEAGNGGAWRRVLELHLRGMAATRTALPSVE